MEDKTFELLTKMYGEFSEFRRDITQKVQESGNHILGLEHNLKNDIKALHDGYNQTYGKLLQVETKVDDISIKVDKQEVEIKVVKGGKAKTYTIQQ